MKNLIIIFVVFFVLDSLNAQVAIGKEPSENASILLEFNDRRDEINGENKTLILPVVSEIHPNTVPGSIWFDAEDDIIKYMSEDGVVEMTQSGAEIDSPAVDEVGDFQGSIIGAEESLAPGVLVLESTEHAMVLPVVDNVIDVINPEPGSMVYDQSRKVIAVFNGESWHFWGEM